MTPNKKQQEEVQAYQLGIEYDNAKKRYLDEAKRKLARYGYAVSTDSATKNMVHALRMAPYYNSPEDWARLHVTEFLLKGGQP